jgi:hypothetical protein
MNQFNKNLMIVITIILLIFIIQNGINNYENKLYNTFRNNTIEKFEGMDLTQISRFEPRQGDSSTIITIEGNGLDFIGEVLFDGRECLIFDDRTDTKVKILPPSLNELGKTIQEVRQIMNDGKDIGLPIKDIQIIRRTADKTNVLNDDKLKLEGIRFHYIDKINYVDNCPKLEEPPKEEPDILEPEEEIDISNENPGSDMEFIKEIIPNKLAHLEKLIEKQNNIIQYYETLNIDNNNIEYLSQIQALETLANLKKEFNIQRFNIHKTMASRYGYSF